MSSKTDIANQALSRIGSKTIMDMDDDTSVGARTVKNIFELSVREISRRHWWNFLGARRELARLTAGPEFGFEYQYPIPTDCLRLKTVNMIEVWDNPERYQLEGRNILTNEAACKITYVRYDEDPTRYDPLFIEALVILLASKMAITIRQDENLSRSFKDEYERMALPAAKKANGQEQHSDRILISRDSRWIAARRYSTNG